MLYALLASLCLYKGTITNIDNNVITVYTDNGHIYDFYGDNYNINSDIILIMDDLGHIINVI